MDGPRDYSTQQNKPEKERQISCDITYMQNLKKLIRMNLFIKQKLTHRYRKQIYGWQQRIGGRDKLGIWD